VTLYLAFLGTSVLSYFIFINKITRRIKILIHHNIIKYSMILIMLIPLSVKAQVQQSVTRSIRITTDSVSIYFRQGMTRLDLQYMQNESRLASFAQRYKELSSDSSVVVASVTITGCASPESSFSLNQHLAFQRAANIRDYLKHQFGMKDSLIVIIPQGIAWTAVAQSIETLSLMPGRDVILDIIRNTPETIIQNGKCTEPRRMQLMALDGGLTWSYLLKNVFPKMRNSSVKVELDKMIVVKKDTTSPVDSTVSVSPDTISSAITIPVKDEWRRLIFALRSNLLTPGMSIGAEVPIGESWSIGADYYYPWIWRKDDMKNCFQLTFFSGEVRHWFGRHRSFAGSDSCNYVSNQYDHRLLGHSAALYAAWGYYDFGHNWSGHQGNVYSIGADYLYAVPIFKGRLHLEFQLAVGFIHSLAQPYDVKEWGGHLIRRKDVKKDFNYFGPTKIGISIVLPITRKETKR
jgi:hypothetical protein